MARAATVALVLAACLLAGPDAPAQEDAGPPGSPDKCRPGELCGTGDVEERSAGSQGSAPEVPGRHLRALITLGFIAAIIGTYLFVALTGRNPFAAARRAGRRT